MEAYIFDTETADITGGICDIAIAKLDDHLNITWECESLIDPERPISPSAMGVHHITEEMVADAPTLSQFMEMHHKPFMVPELVVGGHNVPFDLRAVGPTWFPPTYRKLDTLKLARMIWPDAPDHKLQTLRYMLKLDAGTAHRALGDVYTCVSLLRLIAEQKGIWLQGLLDLGDQPPSVETAFPFGKHKGIKIKDLPISYVRWALEKMDNLDGDLRSALQLRVS